MCGSEEMISNFTRYTSLFFSLLLLFVSGGSLAEVRVPVTVECSETVTQTPILYFTDAAYQTFAVSLEGQTPGAQFSGELVLGSGVANGPGIFTLEENCLIDIAGNTGNTITSGGTYYVDQPEPTATETPVPTDTPTSTPTDTPVDTPTATSTPTDTPVDTPTATSTPTDTPVDTPTATSTATDTPVDTPTATSTATDTSTPTETPSVDLTQDTVTVSYAWREISQIMFSIPIELEQNDPEQVFGPFLGPLDRFSWRVLTYSPQLGRYLEYGVDPNFPGLVPGRAFFLTLNEPRNISLNLQGRAIRQDAEFSIPLKAGYNQIGSRFLYSVAFDDLEVERNGQRVSIVQAARRGWVSNQLWYYDSNANFYRFDIADFGSIMTIEPWRGYWIYVKKDLTLILPPFPHEAPSKGKGSVTQNAQMTTASVMDLPPSGSKVTLLTAQGDLVSGAGSPIASCGLGWDIARSVARWQGGYLVLDGFGGLHALGDAQPVDVTPEFDCDLARRIITRPEGYYLLDGFGGLHAGGEVPELPQAVRFEEDLARDVELVELSDDSVDALEAEIMRLLPVPSPPGQLGVGKQLAYYLLDAYGRVYPVGGVAQLGYVQLDAPVAKDMAVTPGGDGYYIVDAYGRVYGFGNAPVFEGDTPVFDHARIERIVAVEGGYYLLDAFGLVYAAGAAPELPLSVTFGFDSVRDVLIDR